MTAAIGTPRVAVIYHFFPHYRAPVMRALAADTRYTFEFWGAHRGVDGIPVFTGDGNVRVNEIGLAGDGGRVSLSRCWAPMWDRGIKAMIILGNPNIRQTWLLALFGRLLGKRILFWTHGWLKPEPPAKAWLRNLYFSLADQVLVYGDRARELAARSGFDRRRVTPIYNSLDWDAAAAHYAALDAAPPPSGQDGRPYSLICTARLTPICRFDLLLEAMVQLKAQGRQVRLTLVGDGPDRSALEDFVQTRGLDVLFTGAVYDETKVASLIYQADLTVSPGKIGLTALHSLSYGCPAVTHDNLDRQMPEVEAIIPGRTGALFREGDAVDLARVIAEQMDRATDRCEVRRACRNAVAQRWTPAAQRGFIDSALDQLGLNA